MLLLPLDIHAPSLAVQIIMFPYRALCTLMEVLTLACSFRAFCRYRTALSASGPYSGTLMKRTRLHPTSLLLSVLILSSFLLAISEVILSGWTFSFSFLTSFFDVVAMVIFDVFIGDIIDAIEVVREERVEGETKSMVGSVPLVGFAEYHRCCGCFRILMEGTTESDEFVMIFLSSKQSNRLFISNVDVISIDFIALIPWCSRCCPSCFLSFEQFPDAQLPISLCKPDEEKYRARRRTKSSLRGSNAFDSSVLLLVLLVLEAVE